VVDKNGNYTPGSKGLSLFFAQLRDENGKLNGVRVQRLKNKMGTKAVPTAELELNGMKAELIGELGRGVPTIATILNITRIHQAIDSSGAMRNSVQLIQDYAVKRKTFGKPLYQHALHVKTLSWLETETRVATEMSFHVILLLGKSECGMATKTELSLLRLLTPLIKMFVAKRAIAVISEAMEAMGGLGYIEESGFPRYLRDVQVGSIWEGTTNVLSLDVIRVFKATPESFLDFEQFVRSRFEKARPIKEVSEAIHQTEQAFAILKHYIEESIKKGWIEAGARDLVNTMSRIYGATLLTEAMVTSKNGGVGVEARCLLDWCQNGLVSYSAVFPRYADLNSLDLRLALNRSLL